MANKVFDLVIIGGGINGCGIAADAAMRGLHVALFEREDLASKTSSASSKLIHGGLRYLEHYHFSLVHKALNERQNLLTLAPHLVHPLPFIIPCQANRRSLLKLKLGLFLYDHLNQRNTLPSSQFTCRSEENPFFLPLLPFFEKCFSFYDCITDDARLTIANAQQAKAHGASIFPRTECMHAQMENQVWSVTLKNSLGQRYTVKTRALVNATGPWVNAINQRLNLPNPYQLTLVKGSHLVVEKLYEGQHGYLLQHEDNRIIFTIPFHGYTLIGTTEVPLNEPLENLAISEGEINYLLDVVTRYFDRPFQKERIIHSWSGVRPLLAHEGKNLSTLSRDYCIAFSNQPGPAVTLYGGKITTYRQAAVEVVNRFTSLFPCLGESKTRHTPLPGSKNSPEEYQHYLLFAEKKYAWLEPKIRARYLQNYGTKIEQILKTYQRKKELGQHFGHGLYQIEVDYLCQNEWALTAEDILWRRSKLGLCFSVAEKEKLAAYLSVAFSSAMIPLTST